jgi:uncharacterized membrane protein YfcA
MELALTVIAGAALAGFVQGLSGFGFGLTAMSIWAWTLDPPLAAVLSVFGALTGQVVAALTVRRGWNLQRLLPFIAGGLVGLPVGLAILPRLDIPTFKTVLGLFLVVVCPLMFFAARLPQVRGGRLGDAVAGAAGGVMSGIGGFSGVVPTLWLTLRGWPKDEQRSVIQSFNLALLTASFAGFLLAGFVTRPMLPLLAIVPPAMLLPSLLGTRMYGRISDQDFRKVVLGLLFASGVALLASGARALLLQGTHG